MDVIQVLVVVSATTKEIQTVSNTSQRMASTRGRCQAATLRDFHPSVEGQTVRMKVLIVDFRVGVILEDTSPEVGFVSNQHRR